MTNHRQTPSQTIGPFFHDALMRDGVDDLDPNRDAGRPLIIVGSVRDGAGEPVDDAMIELWQPNGDGRFRHPLDLWDATSKDSFIGFGRVATDLQGGFRLRTVIPGTVPSPTGETQAPHLNVHIFARGLLNRLMTRIYFDGLPENATDPVLNACAPERRATLTATADGTEEDIPRFRFDIRLQGDEETVFFAL